MRPNKSIQTEQTVLTQPSLEPFGEEWDPRQQHKARRVRWAEAEQAFVQAREGRRIAHYMHHGTREQFLCSKKGQARTCPGGRNRTRERWPNAPSMRFQPTQHGGAYAAPAGARTGPSQVPTAPGRANAYLASTMWPRHTSSSPLSAYQPTSPWVGIRMPSCSPYPVKWPSHARRRYSPSNMP